MKQPIVKYLLTVVLLITVCLQSLAQAEKPEDDIKNIMKELDVVGLSVAVVKKGKIIYNNAFGLKDIATNTPLATNHLFRIASISKSFSQPPSCN